MRSTDVKKYKDILEKKQEESLELDRLGVEYSKLEREYQTQNIPSLYASIRMAQVFPHRTIEVLQYEKRASSRGVLCGFQECCVRLQQPGPSPEDNLFV